MVQTLQDLHFSPHAVLVSLDLLLGDNLQSHLDCDPAIGLIIVRRRPGQREKGRGYTASSAMFSRNGVWSLQRRIAIGVQSW